jgi:predicted  nucleic acid-binding Zn-ribbon protein
MDRYHTRTGDKLRELRQDKAMLQGALDAANEQVERLSEADDDARRAHVQLDAAMEQNDRLRAQLALMVDPEIGRLREEVEMLERRAHTAEVALRLSTTEVKRLRAAGAKEAAEHVTHCMQMENEVRRLRAEWAATIEENTRNAEEVERLRALHEVSDNADAGGPLASPATVARRALGLLLP